MENWKMVVIEQSFRRAWRVLVRSAQGQLPFSVDTNMLLPELALNILFNGRPTTCDTIDADAFNTA
jgi:hypothetical protein